MQLNIRQKIVLLVGGPTTLVFVAVMFWILGSNERQARRLAEVELATEVREAAAQFEGFLVRAARVADVAARFMEVAPELGEAQLYDLLEADVEVHSQIYGSAIAFEPGTVPGRPGLFAPYVFRDRGTGETTRINIDETVYDWYRDEQWEWWHLPRRTGRGEWTRPYFDEGAGDVLMVTYSAPFERSGAFAGVTTVDLDLEELGDELAEILGGARNYYILDADGTVVLSPERADLLTRPIRDLGTDESETAELFAADGTLVADSLLRPEPALYAAAPVSTTGWYLIGYRPEAGATPDLAGRQRTVQLAFLSGLAAMLATLLFVASRVRGRERQLELSRDETVAEVLESVPDAMIVVGPDGRIARLNEQMVRMFGYARDEVEGMLVHQLLPERFRAAHHHHLTSFFRDPGAREMGSGLQLVGRTRDGRELPIEVGLSSFREPAGVRAVAAIRDVTARREQEDRLRKLNQAVEQGSSMVIITDLEGRIDYVNRRFTEVTGFSVDEVRGRDPKTLKADVHDEDFHARMWEELSRNHVWQGELCNLKKDGSSYWVQASIAAVRDDKGRITHYIGIEEDITEDREIRREIERQERRYRTVLANIPGAVYRCAHDEDWTMRFLSDQIEDLTGYPAADFVDNAVRTYDSVIHPEDRKRVAAEVAEAIGRREPWNIRYRVVHRSGETRWVGERGRASAADGADSDGWLDGVVVDLTQEVEMEGRLQSAMRAAEEANRAKSDFLSNMSHELRTPLNGVLGYAQILERDEALRDRHQANVQSILHCGEHLLSLINDVLDLSKIEAGRMEIHDEPLEVAGLVRRVSDIVSQRAAEKGLNLTVDVADEVPAAIVADRAKLRQILINLLGNAVKFTEEGAIGLRVGVRNGSRVVFRVEDSGVGMTEEELAVVFDAFRQAEGGRKSGGTGLGLAICTRLAEHMGGELTVESEPGRGSVFTLDLPLREADPGSVSDATPSEVARGSTLAPGRRPVVLVADDLQVNRDVLEQLLTDIGFAVETVDDGDVALERAGEGAYDLILMDVQMPRMSGTQAVARMREMPGLADLPIIAVTASVFPEFRREALAAGFTDFLGKPFHLDQLLALLHRHLDVEWVESDGGRVSQPSPPARGTETRSPDTPAGGLDAVEGLDVGGAVAMLGSRALWEQVLRDFAWGEAPGMPAAIARHLREGNTDAAIRVAHSLKGLAGTVGIRRVQTLAGEIEEALRAQETWEVIEPVRSALAVELDRLVDAVRPWVGDAPDGNTESEAITAPELSSTARAELVAALGVLDLASVARLAEVAGAGSAWAGAVRTAAEAMDVERLHALIPPE